MSKAVKLIILSVIAFAVTSCSSESSDSPVDNPTASNQITVNGTKYDIDNALIIYYKDERNIYLICENDGYISFAFNNRDTQIPTGQWTTIDKVVFEGIELKMGEICYLFSSSSAVNIRVSGTDGGTLTVEGTIADASSKVNCSFSYSGIYAYEED